LKVSKNFIIQEFVPENLYNIWGNKSIYFVDKRCFKIAQFIRDRFNKTTTINNWYFGNTLNNRGFRMPNSTVGGTLSQHKFGRAIDFNVDGMSSKEIFEDIKNNKELYFNNFITTVENVKYTPSWIHLDCRFTNQKELIFVNP